jgi:type I restriction enzyme M protein
LLIIGCVFSHSLAEYGEETEPVVAKKHQPGKVEPDPLRCLCDVTLGGKHWVVEYEPDPELRDTKQIP